MKFKTLFRVMLKGFGVFFFVAGLPQLLRPIEAMIRLRDNANIDYKYELIIPGIQMAVALYLFFGGKWIVDLAIPSNRPYCHECGYDLTGAPGNVCNECGTPFRSSEVTATHD